MPMGIYDRPSIQKRFWSKVSICGDEECWEWKGAINSTGRGLFTIKRINYKAHRFSWFLVNGEIPAGLLVCHTCDNGKCVNPNHLFLGTYRDNVLDMIRKGRGNVLCGENDPKSKLTEEQVKVIKSLWKPRQYSQYRLAREFGVSRTTIQSIVNRRNWKHIK
jgi:hypothetical protein